MYRVGVCGRFGENSDLLSGQIVKTKILTEEIKKALGLETVQTVDTHKWKKNLITLIIKCFILIKNSKNIIILPARNGVKVIVPLFLLLNNIFHRKLHYVVIGGWLPELLEKKHKLLKNLSKFDGIYVETNVMVVKLQKLGLNNVINLPNFKRLEILEERELVYPTGEPYKLCTFSRVMKEKGIEDAIEAVKVVNNSLGRTAYTLDIYGQIYKEYIERFDELKKNFPEYITYKGVVNYSESVKILKDYFALLFPTYYQGEGFAGTILDAYSSGLPVIATNWKYNPEIIKDYIDGLIFENHNIYKLKEILLEVIDNPKIVLDMKKNCLERARQYSPENVISVLLKYL